MKLYDYDNGSHTTRFFCRDVEEVGFTTDKLDMGEAKRLSDFVESVWLAGIRYGRVELSERIRAELVRG